MPTRLLWKHVAAKEDAFHISNLDMKGIHVFQHTHDFAEVFVVLHGSCQHLLDNTQREIVAGDLVFLRPEHLHGFRCDDDVRMANVAFPLSTLRHMNARYGQHPHFPWNSKTPVHMRLTHSELKEVAGWIDGLMCSPRSALGLDRYLLTVLWLVFSRVNHVPVAGLPNWLEQAIRQIQNPSGFSLGSPHFVKLCQRSAEHVARTTKTLLNQTPSDLVNDARMKYAANRLQHSNDSILDIVYDCGLESVGHFYDLFAQRFGITPAAYRRLKQPSHSVFPRHSRSR